MAKVGDTIKIVYMEGEPRYSGKVGKITHIDSMGQYHGTWGGLAVQPQNDDYEIVNE